MNNEIGRKITSLTLMTIMLASAFAAGAPSVLPQAAAANANLFVSAEKPQFQNTFGGPMVIEVVVIDSDIKDTDKGKGEPDVTINGNDFRMVQATDGNWYGYLADRNQAQIADQAAQDFSGLGGKSLDFGELCKNDSTVLGFQVTGTTGIAIPWSGINNGVNGTASLQTCTDAKYSGLLSKDLGNVVRENKTVNSASGIPVGQIGFTNKTVANKVWPFIQLYDFQIGGNVVVQYNKGGGVQSTTLKFDTADEFAKAETDRTTYPRGADVHLTVTDIQLNIDPTDEDSWTFETNATKGLQATYQAFDENGVYQGDYAEITSKLPDLMLETADLSLNPYPQGGKFVIQLNDTDNTVITTGANITYANSGNAANWSYPVTLTELEPNTGVFSTFDEDDDSEIRITDDAPRGKSATISYDNKAKSILVGFGTATVDIKPIDAEWNSGEEIPVTVTDSDANKNSRVDEDLNLYDPQVALIPALKLGTPATLGDGITDARLDSQEIDIGASVQKYSDRAMFKISTVSVVGNTDTLDIEFSSWKNLKSAVPYNNPSFKGKGLMNYDVRSLRETALINATSVDITVSVNGGAGTPVNNQPLQGLINYTKGDYTAFVAANPLDTTPIKVVFSIDSTGSTTTQKNQVLPMVVDFFGFGYVNDGNKSGDRVNNMIIRIEAEETGDNTGVFEGSLEYIMLNQLNILDYNTYSGLDTISDTPMFIVNDDLDGNDAPRVNYNDLGADGVTTQVSDQQDTPTHSGVVSFDKSNYKVADTVMVTLEDVDLNVDSELVDIYTTVTTGANIDVVGKNDLPGDLGRLLDITFDDQTWRNQLTNGCGGAVLGSDGLAATGFSLIETGASTGIFTGDYQVPGNYCDDNTNKQTTATGKDMEVNYVDFRDASGNIVEVGDGAGIRANTGSISLDRTVYPVPWGNLDDGDPTTTPNGFSVFPLHKSAIDANGINTNQETLANGDLTIHVQVNDPDYDLSASGEDKIENASANGPVKVLVSRGAQSVVLATAGSDTPSDLANSYITIGKDANGFTRELGPITETAPNSGIFEFDLVLRYTDGPLDNNLCPETDVYQALDGSYDSANPANADDRFNGATNPATDNFCILQGDIITVEYTDETDASGNANSVTDSATFDLRNGALQSDKSVYIIGSDMILTLIEPDFDLDSDQAETFDLDLIEWDSDAATCTIGDRKNNKDCTAANDSFDPEPSDLRETGDNTGIFQSIIEIPQSLGGNKLERGEEIVLEYTDWGPSGSDYVGDEDEDVNLTLFTSNFGATVELDQKVYTWTDKVYITIVAPDHNMDSNLVDTIGDTTDDSVKVATRGHDIDQYHLAETGPDTGIFTGEVILIGFAHDADGKDGVDGPFGTESDDGAGPTDGFLEADDDDGLTVSFEFSEDETVVGSALIRWNIGEVSWLEASYPAVGSGVVRVIDPDMNWNPEAVDNFDISTWSDSDAGGIDLTVTETNEATGIFEGTVYFSTTSESSGARLRVAEGDTVTAEYKDNTLPDPYTTADELDITGTSFIGTVVPPLERAPASNARVVDAFGNTLDEVSVDQQVQVTADLTNGQDREQSFAYLVQIQDENGVTVSLAWITGSLSAGQSFSPALSWIPTASGTYTATVFVWESVDNPTALSPPVSVDITVS